MRDEVGDQDPIVRAVARRYDERIAKIGVAAQRRLDLAALHPEAAPFDLLVGPPDELQRAVGSPPRKIAGRVQPLAEHPWVGDEPQCRPRRIAEVAAREALSSGIQQTGRAVGHRLEISVEQPDPGLGDRPTDRHAEAVARPDRHVVAGRERGYLGRTVCVDQLALGERRPDSLGPRGRELVPAGHKLPQAGEILESFVDHQVE